MRHVLLGATQYEHKVFVPAFSRAFPEAKVDARARRAPLSRALSRALARVLSLGDEEAQARGRARVPRAEKVWAVPGQWSFPLDLPARLLGIDTAGTGGGELVDTSPASNPPPAGAARAAWCAADPRAACATTAAYARAADFTDEFEVKLLRPERRLGLGYAANEAALLHKDTKVAARARG